MTVKDMRRFLPECLGAILPQLPPDGELVVVDAQSTDGTREYLLELGAQGRLRAVSEPCSMGRGRDRGLHLARAPVVLTQVDADVRYEPGLLRRCAEEFSRRRGSGLLVVTGRDDPDPAGTKVYVWDRAFYLASPGYPDTNIADDIGAIRMALGQGRVERWLVPRVGSDLRASERAAGAHAEPWHQGPGFWRVTRRRYAEGWSWRSYLRLLWITRRTFPRYLAGATLASVARLLPGKMPEG